MKSIRLICSQGEFDLREGESLAGSYRHCAIRLDIEGLAGEAARFDRAGDAVTVSQVDPALPVLVDGRAIAGVQPLADGSVVTVGPANLRVAMGEKVGRTTQILPPGGRRRKWLKRAAAAVGALVTLIVIGFIVLRLYVNDEFIREKLKAALEAKVNREIVIGEVDSGFLTGKITVKELVVRNSPGWDDRDLFLVRRAEGEIGVWRLVFSLGGDLRAALVADSVEAHLYRHKNGRVNWTDLFVKTAGEKGKGKEAEKGAEAPFRWESGLRDAEVSVEIKTAKVTFLDAMVSEKPIEFDGIRFLATQKRLTEPLVYSLDIPWPGRTAALKVSGAPRLFDKNGVMSAETIRGEDLMTIAGDPIDIDVLLAHAGRDPARPGEGGLDGLFAPVRFSAAVAAPDGLGAATFRLRADSPHIDLSRFTGARRPAPEEAMREPAALAVDLNVDAVRGNVSGSLVFSAPAGMAARGSIDIRDGGRGKLEAALTAGAESLKALRNRLYPDEATAPEAVSSGALALEMSVSGKAGDLRMRLLARADKVSAALGAGSRTETRDLFVQASARLFGPSDKPMNNLGDVTLDTNLPGVRIGKQRIDIEGLEEPERLAGGFDLPIDIDWPELSKALGFPKAAQERVTLALHGEGAAGQWRLRGASTFTSRDGRAAGGPVTLEAAVDADFRAGDRLPLAVSARLRDAARVSLDLMASGTVEIPSETAPADDPFGGPAAGMDLRAQGYCVLGDLEGRLAPALAAYGLNRLGLAAGGSRLEVAPGAVRVFRKMGDRTLRVSSDFTIKNARTEDKALDEELIQVGCDADIIAGPGGALRIRAPRLSLSSEAADLAFTADTPWPERLAGTRVTIRLNRLKGEKVGQVLERLLKDRFPPELRGLSGSSVVDIEVRVDEKGDAALAINRLGVQVEPVMNIGLVGDKAQTLTLRGAGAALEDLAAGRPGADAAERWLAILKGVEGELSLRGWADMDRLPPALRGKIEAALGPGTAGAPPVAGKWGLGAFTLAVHDRRGSLDVALDTTHGSLDRPPFLMLKAGRPGAITCKASADWGAEKDPQALKAEVRIVQGPADPKEGKPVELTAAVRAPMDLSAVTATVDSNRASPKTLADVMPFLSKSDVRGEALELHATFNAPWKALAERRYGEWKYDIRLDATKVTFGCLSIPEFGVDFPDLRLDGDFQVAVTPREVVIARYGARVGRKYDDVALLDTGLKPPLTLAPRAADKTVIESLMTGAGLAIAAGDITIGNGRLRELHEAFKAVPGDAKAAAPPPAAGPRPAAAPAAASGRFDFFKGFSVAVGVAAGTLEYAPFRADGFQGRIDTVAPNKLRAAVRGGRAYEGGFQGNVDIDLNAPDVEHAGELSLTDIQVNPLMAGAYKYAGVFYGRFNGRFRWNGRGAGLEDMQKRWSANLEASLTQTEIRDIGKLPVAQALFEGVEKAPMLSALAPLKGVAGFKELSAGSVSQFLGLGTLKDVYRVRDMKFSVTLDKGWVRLAPFDIEGPKGMCVRLSGGIDLEGRLDGRVALTAFNADWRLPGEAKVLEKPLRDALAAGKFFVPVKGTWSKPEIDWSGFGKSAGDAIAAAVKDAVKRLIEDKVKKEMEDKLKKELEHGLKGLIKKP